MTTVAFTQPYVPAYRVPLFDELERLLNGDGIALAVFASRPHGEQALRGDNARASWLNRLEYRTFKAGTRELQWRLAPRRLLEADVIVSELAVTNNLAWSLSHKRVPLILWGHGKSYVTAPNRFSDAARNTLARRAAHVMTYADGGRNHLLSAARLPLERVTAIGNSTDTATLRRDLRSLSDIDRRKAIDLVGSETASLFIGGLDASKRIQFVLDAHMAAMGLNPEHRLIIIGRGALESEVMSAAHTIGGITYVAEARGRRLAELSAAATSIWMPGRVGLVATDALALGLPILTTHHDLHAPEIEFLRDGEINFLPNDPRLFAEEASIFAGRQKTYRDDIPSVEAVALKMAACIRQSLA